jgi:hypothetical protein
MRSKLAPGTAERVTVYRYVFVGYSKMELRACAWRIVDSGPHYVAPVETSGFPHRARRRRKCEVGSGPGVVILEGWGHPDFGAPAHMISASEFDKWLFDYVKATGSKILADFRKHTYRGKAVPRKKAKA